MKAKKLSRVEELEKKLHTTIKMTEQLLMQNSYLKDLAIGTLETIKLMEGYEQAINKLKEKMAKQSSKAETFISDGKTSE